MSQLNFFEVYQLFFGSQCASYVLHFPVAFIGFEPFVLLNEVFQQLNQYRTIFPSLYHPK